MERRLKFYGWGHEGEGLDEAERARLFRFLAEKLGAEPRALSPPPQASEIALSAPRISAPASLAGVLTQDPYERLLHTYGKSYPETVRALARDFANAPDFVALPETEADIAAVFDWASGAKSQSFRSAPARRWWAASSLWSATATPARSASTCGG